MTDTPRMPIRKRLLHIAFGVTLILQGSVIFTGSAHADTQRTRVAPFSETYYVTEEYTTTETYSIPLTPVTTTVDVYNYRTETYSIPLTPVTTTVDVYNYRTETYSIPLTPVTRRVCAEWIVFWGERACARWETTTTYVCQARGGCGPFERQVRIAPFTETTTTYVCQARGGCGPFERQVTKTRQVAKTREVYNYADVPHEHPDEAPEDDDNGGNYNDNEESTDSSQDNGDPCAGTWAENQCREVEERVGSENIPTMGVPSYKEDLNDLLTRVGDQPGFDAGEAKRKVQELADGTEVTRDQMAEVLCAGLGISGSSCTPQELEDRGITVGRLEDPPGGCLEGDRLDNGACYDRESTMSNDQLVTFISRTLGTLGNNGNGGDDDDDTGNTGNTGNTGDPPNNGGGDPPGDEVEPCTTGLSLSASDQTLFVSQLQWRTLVDIRAQGAPGEVWPPHPEVPGGSEYLVVSESPVWPVVDTPTVWSVASDDGCLWEAVSVQTRVIQLVPWRPNHRAIIESQDSSRPDAGFDTYLSRWDNLNAAQQTAAQQYHRDRDVSASCRIEQAMVATDSASRCTWELPSPGVWSWQARACFEGVANDRTVHDCATLDSGVEWFLDFNDYTEQITLLKHVSVDD